MQFNEVTDLKIIEFIRNNRIFYDNTNENHRDYKLRDKLWAALSKQLKLSVTDLKNRWKSLRDSYRIILIKRNRTRELGDKYISRYKYEEQLQFLEPYFKPYQPRRNFRRRNFMKRKPPTRRSSDFNDFTLETEIIEDSPSSPVHLSNDITNEQDFSNGTSEVSMVPNNNVNLEWIATKDTINSKNHDANLTNPAHSNSDFNKTKAIRIEDVVTVEEESMIPMPQLSPKEVGDEVSSFFHYAVIATKILPPERQQNVISKIFDAITEAKSKSHINDYDIIPI